MIKLDTKRILIPLDFSTTAAKAIKHGALMAKHSNGELFLLYVRRKDSALNLAPSTAELRQIAADSESYKRLMEDTAQRIRNQYDIPVKVLVTVGGRISEIMNVAEKRKIGLIVMGTEGSDSVSNLFSGSNSHRVVSKSEIPVMTIRTDFKKEGYTTILLPIDLSEHTRQKVNVAIQIAKMHTAKIQLLGLLSQSQESSRTKLLAFLKQIEKRIKADEIPVSSEVIQTNDAITRTLIYAKQKKADIIITMTDQQAGSSAFLSKSYDHALVDESAIPVLSIPPEIHEENIEPASIGGLW